MKAKNNIDMHCVNSIMHVLVKTYVKHMHLYTFSTLKEYTKNMFIYNIHMPFYATHYL